MGASLGPVATRALEATGGATSQVPSAARVGVAPPKDLALNQKKWLR